jgi:hypothetical protein
MDIEHNLKQQRFSTIYNGREYSLEYNVVDSDLWEFHCPYIPHIITNLKLHEIQDNLIDYALRYMARNKIRILENGSCYHVKDFLDKAKDLRFLLKVEQE